MRVQAPHWATRDTTWLEQEGHLINTSYVVSLDFGGWHRYCSVVTEVLTLHRDSSRETSVGRGGLPHYWREVQALLVVSGGGEETPSALPQE